MRFVTYYDRSFKGFWNKEKEEQISLVSSVPRRHKLSFKIKLWIPPQHMHPLSSLQSGIAQKKITETFTNAKTSNPIEEHTVSQVYHNCTRDMQGHNSPCDGVQTGGTPSTNSQAVWSLKQFAAGYELETPKISVFFLVTNVVRMREISNSNLCSRTGQPDLGSTRTYQVHTDVPEK